MAITDEFRRIACKAIVVDRDQRQRRQLDDLDDLAASISKRGVLQPIIIDKALHLVAGERRLAASIALELPDIPCRFIEDLSPVELQIIELEENIKRSDLGWKDLVAAIARIHALYRQLDPQWTQTQTAGECNVSHSLVSMYLRVSEMMDDERVAAAGTFNEALNIIKRRDARAAGDALAELIELPTLAAGDASLPAGQSVFLDLPAAAPAPYDPPAQRPKLVVPPVEATILHEDFLRWAPRYAGPRFNFIHCDFPYGIDVFSGPQARGAEPTAGYSDGFNIYTALLECLCRNLNQLMSISAHMVFWYSDKHRDVTRKIFNQLAPSLEIHPYPLIWVKSDNAGIASDPRHGPRHVYETALFISRSKRQIVRVAADAYSAPTNHDLHPSTKPEPMLRHFFQMLVDESTVMLDPTCGSGASIRAAESLAAKATLGLEIDAQFIKPARQALHMARLKLAASRAVA